MSGWPHDLNVRSIRTWPATRTPDHKREHARFRSGLSDTLGLLRGELQKIRATDVWLEIAVSGDPTTNPREWRQDGRPRANATPSHPGVVLSFKTPVADGRELRVATDRFRTWQDNLRAIALTLAHQRAFERYGTATRGEQYAGWAQLPAPDQPDAGRGRQLIDQLGGQTKALRATHPDTRDPGGPYGDRDFADVQAARGAA